MVIAYGPPTAPSYFGELAIELGYKAHNTGVGDLASEKAVGLHQAGERKRDLRPISKRSSRTPSGSSRRRATGATPTGAPSGTYTDHRGWGRRRSSSPQEQRADLDFVGTREPPSRRRPPPFAQQVRPLATRDRRTRFRQPRRDARYTARLLIGCPDRPGIVAAVSGFLFEHGAKSSPPISSPPIRGWRFFLRTEFFLESRRPERARGLRASFAREVAERLAMDWGSAGPGQRRGLAILVSRHDHCLLDLLWRWRRGELDAELVAVIPTIPTSSTRYASPGVPFHHVPVEQGPKEQAEAPMLAAPGGDADLSCWRATCRS